MQIISSPKDHTHAFKKGRRKHGFSNSIRLTNARNKLQSGEYNVSEAAYESGFSNLSFFIRLYKKKYGHTPKNK